MTETKLEGPSVEGFSQQAQQGGASRSKINSPKPVVVLYATREGQTRKIAESVAFRLNCRGIETQLTEVGQASDLDLSWYRAAILAASVHAGNHECEMVQFVKKHKEPLETLPTAFISVTLSQAGVERR